MTSFMCVLMPLNKPWNADLQPRRQVVAEQTQRLCEVRVRPRHIAGLHLDRLNDCLLSNVGFDNLDETLEMNRPIWSEIENQRRLWQQVQRRHDPIDNVVDAREITLQIP